MPKVEVFDPPMCCSTGVCGPTVDPALVRFAADVDWLRSQGVEVVRYNLAQDPSPFVSNRKVADAMRGRDDALPLLLVDGVIASQGKYPDREMLERLAGVSLPATLYSEAVEELVAIGAAIASNCEPCFRFHYDRARKLGVSKVDMARAVATADKVRQAPARAVLELAHRYLGGDSEGAPEQPCCSPSEAAPVTLVGIPAAPKKCC